MLRWKIAQWFELRWWKNYLYDKNEEEYLAWKKKYWKEILSKIFAEVGIDSSKTVCDLGCGPAGIFIALPENKITVVDPLIDEYEMHTTHFKKRNYNQVNFVRSIIEDFETLEPFDFVFCMNVINHVQDIGKSFEKLNSLCGKDGTVVLSIDAHNFSFFKYLFRIIPGDILHPHQFDLNEYQNFFEKHEMKIVKMELLKQEFFFNHYLLVAQKKMVEE